MEHSKNRSLIAASAVGIHISIGSVYAYSVMTKPVAELLGTTPSEVKVAFSLAIFFLGMSAAFLGRLVERIGPRKSGILAALFYGVGIGGAGLSVQLGSLPLFYLTYGVLGGIGLGVGYITPVSTLVKWFPDRRGMATGIAIMGFGFAALIFGPVMARLFIAGHDASGAELYTVLSVSRTFYLLGALYFVLIFGSALYIAPPPPGYQPPGAVERRANTDRPKAPDLAQLTAKESLGTRRFYFIWLMMFVNITCGIAVIASASPMVQQMFGTTAIEAAGIVGLIGVFNGLGRILWATLSDFLGRANTFIGFFAIQIIAFFALPRFESLLAFQIVLYLVITCYGGGFATLPAFLGDLFGTKQLGAVHGLVLTAWAAAGVAGPTLQSILYERTRDYGLTLTVFAGFFVVALFVSLAMKADILRIQRRTPPDLLPSPS